jgi:hypothetical protein
MVRAAAAQEGGDIEETLRRYGKTHPIGRIGTGQDIADLVTFSPATGPHSSQARTS